MHDQNMIKTLFLKPATTKHGSEMEEYERKREKPIPACKLNHSTMGFHITFKEMEYFFSSN